MFCTLDRLGCLLSGGYINVVLSVTSSERRGRAKPAQLGGGMVPSMGNDIIVY